jgi:hypothetical protein
MKKSAADDLEDDSLDAPDIQTRRREGFRALGEWWPNQRKYTVESVELGPLLDQHGSGARPDTPDNQRLTRHAGWARENVRRVPRETDQEIEPANRLE